nr:hypothetical protein [Tanacetum cinerariifolium]
MHITPIVGNTLGLTWDWDKVPHNVYNKAHQRSIDHNDKSHEDPHNGHNKDIVVEDSMNHMDKKYSFHCSPVPTHNEAGTEADNHNQIENHFHMNHTSKSHMWGVEGDHFHTARTYTIDKPFDKFMVCDSLHEFGDLHALSQKVIEPYSRISYQRRVEHVTPSWHSPSFCLCGCLKDFQERWLWSSEHADTLLPLFPNLLNMPPSFSLDFCLDDLDRSHLILENRLGLGLQERLDLCLLSCSLVFIILDSEYHDVLEPIGYSSYHNTPRGMGWTRAHRGLVELALFLSQPYSTRRTWVG